MFVGLVALGGFAWTDHNCGCVCEAGHEGRSVREVGSTIGLGRLPNCCVRMSMSGPMAASAGSVENPLKSVTTWISASLPNKSRSPGHERIVIVIGQGAEVDGERRAVRHGVDVLAARDRWSSRQSCGRARDARFRTCAIRAVRSRQRPWRSHCRLPATSRNAPFCPSPRPPRAASLCGRSQADWMSALELFEQEVRTAATAAIGQFNQRARIYAEMLGTPQSAPVADALLISVAELRARVEQVGGPDASPGSPT